MGVILSMCMLIQIAVFIFYWDFPENTKLPTVMLTVIFLLGIMFNPFDFFNRITRFEIVKALGNIIISPFGIVRFRDFFLADVITSAKPMLVDSTAMVCFYTSREFDSESPVSCSWQPNVNYAWGIAPYWWRFW